MAGLILLGVLSALFFSATFILNRAISLEGGHWVWTACLRYGYMLIFLSVCILFTRGPRAFSEIGKIFSGHWRFWMAAGTVGFGVFYALISFSASYAAGWIVAATWQTTIAATPIVLVLFFRKPVPKRGLALTALIFAGAVLVNMEYAASVNTGMALYGALPVLIAAFAYPIGNQLVWEAMRGGHKRIPHITDPILANSLARVLLLTMGSVPFWVVLVLVTLPPPPSSGQMINTAMIALFSGVIATTLFLHARNRCNRPVEIAAVDATQSMEVIFSLAGEIIFLHGMFPGATGMTGIALTLAGLAVYMRVRADIKTA